MDEVLKEICKKACVEYCENGFVSEPVFNSLINYYESINFNDSEEMKAFMRNFIVNYIQANNLPCRNNTCIYTLTSSGVLRGFIISKVPKDLHILPF